MTTQSTHSAVKWGGAALFLVIIGAGAFVVYQIQDLNKAGSTVATAPTKALIKDVPTPATVTNVTDLASVEKSLDTTDLNQITSDLSANESDLASF